MDNTTIHSTILLGLSGSKAYGTDTDESDTDYRGIFIPDEGHYFGLRRAKEYSSSSGGQHANTKEDVDVSLSPIASFVARCMKNSPVDLELLFLRESDYMNVTPIGAKLIDSRHLFLSKRVKNRFGGYAISQAREMMKGSRVDDALGYDTKALMHSVRLYQMGIEILKTGTFSTYRGNHETLKELRAGKFTLQEAKKYLEGLELELRYYYERSQLPDEPDEKVVQELLISLTKEHLGYHT